MKVENGIIHTELNNLMSQINYFQLYSKLCSDEVSGSEFLLCPLREPQWFFIGWVRAKALPQNPTSFPEPPKDLY